VPLPSRGHREGADSTEPRLGRRHAGLCEHVEIDRLRLLTDSSHGGIISVTTSWRALCLTGPVSSSCMVGMWRHCSVLVIGTSQSRRESCRERGWLTGAHVLFVEPLPASRCTV